MKPAISIIIPAHNEENYLRKTLHSIKQQTFQNYEVLIVANGCTDKTEDIARKRANDKVSTLSMPRANVCAARNMGALNASADLLLFLDADTQLSPDTLQKMSQEFTDEIAVASTKVKPDTALFKYKTAMWLKNKYNSLSFYQGCSGALLCRKKDFHEVGAYDPEITLREHRRLIKALQKKGKYISINTHVTTSMRRFEQWGLGGAVGFWIKQFFKDSFSSLKNVEYEKVR